MFCSEGYAPFKGPVHNGALAGTLICKGSYKVSCKGAYTKQNRGTFKATVPSRVLYTTNIVASIIRIGVWGITYSIYVYNKAPQNSVGNCLGPYLRHPAETPLGAQWRSRPRYGCQQENLSRKRKLRV